MGGAIGPEFRRAREEKTMKKKIGLFGLLTHAVIVIGFLLSRAMQGEKFGPDLLFAAVPLLLASSFAVYALVVARYVERREGMQKPIVIDSLVGILVEVLIFALAGLLFGLYDGLRTGAASESGLAGGLLISVVMNVLWVYATFMVHIIVLGNLCGLAGWYLLRKQGSLKP